VIELHPFAVAKLRRHRFEQARMRLFFGPGYDVDADLVIAKADGSAYHPDSLTNAFRLLARKVGLPGRVSLHGLRHAVASFLAAEGTSASDIAAVLGHADRGQLAQRVYIRPLEDAPARAAKRLGRALGWKEASS
jgi:integrase